MSQDFSQFFWLKRFDLTGKNGFANIFVFAKISDRKDRKSSVTTRTQKFSVDTAVFKLLNYCNWMCKHTQIFFLPDCSFKICEKPSKFSKSVRVVFDVSAQSLTLPGKFADTMSAQSLSSLTSQNQVPKDYLKKFNLALIKKTESLYFFIFYFKTYFYKIQNLIQRNLWTDSKKLLTWLNS